MTADDFRRIVLDLPGAIEGKHMGHPDFRVNGRIFASIHSNDTMGMIKLAPEEQEVLLREHPATFVPSPGAWGRQGCTNVRFDTADARSVRGAVLLAWERTSALSPARARKPAGAVRAAAPASARTRKAPSARGARARGRQGR